VVSAGGMEMRGTIAAVEEALRLHARGDAILPPKVSITWGTELDTDERHGRIMALPAYVGGEVDVAGLKWISSVPSNPSRGLPRGIGLIVLTDRATGLPVAVLDGMVVSAMRTGAVTWIATRKLGNPDATIAAILGAGVQARTQLMALEEVMDLREVRVWDIDAERSRAFCAREARDGVTIDPVDDPADACRGASVIVAATMAPEPYVPPSWIADGALFISISSLDPTLELVAAADLLVCDSWEHETGHPSRLFARALSAGIISRERVVQLGEVLVGAVPGRTDRTQRILVSPVGLGIEDVAAAARVVRRAAEAGIGTRLELWKEPVWT
jgi:ornithine cyclodeaminase/alanine dehydrogenase-like protein (mu-crystallin family)